MDPREDDALSRRGFLVGSAGAAAAAAASATGAAQEDGDGGGQDGGGGQEGDAGGGGAETVELVDYAYEPGTESPLSIAPGTTVLFVWETDNHNINVTEQPDDSDWEGHMPIENSGFEVEHTFEVEGTYAFHCDPHLSLGMEGTIEVAEGGGGEAAAGPVSAIPDAAYTLLIATVAGMVSTLALVYFFMRYGGEPAA
ncbi:plastocyanin/azurin family copper-binding protein [Salinilacihabitans rarus]|uniref:plastocyanin/azurin family copper-binding protein n=1 Tax=Salinilacihabitans rarus TaxID=2961596 RepID=UPI0020C8DC4C|nr:plastocyanin/azurin family copper-binding protein [Salinilacihabitans rarus]